MVVALNWSPTLVNFLIDNVNICSFSEIKMTLFIIYFLSDVTRDVGRGIEFSAVHIETSHVTSEDESFAPGTKTSAS